MTKKPSSENQIRIRAFAWKADELGLSYGKLQVALDDGEAEQIVKMFKKRMETLAQEERDKIGLRELQRQKKTRREQSTDTQNDGH